VTGIRIAAHASTHVCRSRRVIITGERFEFVFCVSPLASDRYRMGPRDWLCVCVCVRKSARCIACEVAPYLYSALRMTRKIELVARSSTSNLRF